MSSQAGTSDEGYARSRTKYVLRNGNERIVGATPKPPEGAEHWSPTPWNAYWSKAQGLSYSYPNPLARPIVACGRDYMMPFEHHVQILRKSAVGIPNEQVRVVIGLIPKPSCWRTRRSNVLWVCNTWQGPLYNIAQLRSHDLPETGMYCKLYADSPDDFRNPPSLNDFSTSPT